MCVCNRLLQQPVLMSRCVVAPRRAASFVFYFGLCSWQLSSLVCPLSPLFLSQSTPYPSLWCCCAFYCCAAAVCVCAEIAFLCILHFNKFLQLRCCLPFMLVFWHDFIYIKNFSLLFSPSLSLSLHVFFISFLPFGLWEIYLAASLSSPVYGVVVKLGTPENVMMILDKLECRRFIVCRSSK